jgi:PKD repeat protein
MRAVDKTAEAMKTRRLGRGFLLILLGWLALIALAQAQGGQWTKIADEGQTFYIEGSKTVRYGAGGYWIQRTVIGSADCSNAFFGSDPLYGTVKQCDVLDAAAGGANAAPLAIFTATPNTATAGTPIALNATASTDSDGTITSYAWTFGDGTSGTGATTSKTYTAGGVYTITLAVTDYRGASGSATRVVVVTDGSSQWTKVADENQTFNIAGSKVVRYGAGDHWIQRMVSGGVDCSNAFFGNDPLYGTVKECDVLEGFVASPNAAPIAIFSATPTTVTAGTAIALNATGSNDSDGTISGYSWTFGDGSSGTGAIISKTYAVGGAYNVSLTVTDNQGATGNAVHTVTVTGGGQWIKVADENQAFTVAGSKTVRYGAGGNWVQLTLTGNAQCSNGFFGSDPLYGTVKECDVLDAGGANAPPLASFTATPDTVAAGTAIALNATASTDSDGLIASYAWTFGDGTTGTGPTIGKTYAAGGTYSIGLAVTDNQGAVGNATRIVTVTDGNSRWIKVADEDQTFVVAGSKTVRYGTGNSWIQRTLSGSVHCSNAFFGGDPAHLIVKECDVLEAGPTSGPTLTNLSPADGALVTGGARPTLAADYADASGIAASTVKLFLDGVDITASSQVMAGRVSYTPAQNLTETMHTVRVTVANTLGKVSEQTWTFDVDSPTTTTIGNLAPSNVLLRAGAQPTISADYADAGGINLGTVKLTLDEVDVTAAAQVTAQGVRYTPPAPLPVGRHVAYLRVTNNQGRTTSALWPFEVDTPAVYAVNNFITAVATDAQGRVDVKIIEAKCWSKSNNLVDWSDLTALGANTPKILDSNKDVLIKAMKDVPPQGVTELEWIALKARITNKNDFHFVLYGLPETNFAKTEIETALKQLGFKNVEFKNVPLQ